MSTTPISTKPEQKPPSRLTCPDPACAHQNPPNARHCSKCGAPLHPPTTRPPLRETLKQWTWVAPVLLAILIYIPALDGELVWDDQIVRDRQLVAFRTIEDVFFPPRGIPEWARSYYRPIVTITYLLDQSLFGRGAIVGPHTMVVLYHALTTLFVWMLARQILRRHEYYEWGAVAAAVIFAVHPIHTETVAWLTGRSDTVATMFLLPSLVLALHWRDCPTSRAASALPAAPLLFLCALLSKEVALGGLLMLPALLFLAPRPANASKRLSIAAWLPQLASFALMTVIYLILRAQADYNYGPQFKADAAEAVRQLFGGLAFYLHKVVVPPPQCALITTVPDWPQGIAAAAAALVLLVLSLWLLWRGHRLLLIALLFYGLTLLPSFGIILRPIAEQKVAERALYAPSVGLCLVVAALFAAALARPALRWVAAVLTLALAAAYAYGTIDRSKVWQNDAALWTDTIEKSPGVGLPVYQLAMYYRKHDQPDKALQHFRQSLELYEQEGDREGRRLAHNSIGVILMNQGQIEQAEAEFRTSIQVDASYPTPYFNLGVIAFGRARGTEKQTGQPDFALLNQAHEYFTKAVTLNPNYVLALNQIALLELTMSTAHSQADNAARADDLRRMAQQHMARLKQIDPHSETTKRTEQAFARAGVTPAAAQPTAAAPQPVLLPLDLQATGVGPGASAYDRGVQHFRSKQYQDALRAFRESLDLSEQAKNDAGRSLAHNGLAVVLVSTGRLSEAEQELHAAAEANPRDPKPHLNLGLLASHRAGTGQPTAGSPDFELLGQARRYLLTAVQLDPHYAQGLFQLTLLELQTAAAHRRLGDMARTRELWREARDHAAQLAQVDPDSDAGQRAAKLVPMLDAELDKTP